MFKSMKRTWQLFSLEDSNPIGVHLTMIATPLILAFGFALILANFVNIVVCVVAAIFVFFLVAYLMGWNNKDENDMIERRLNNVDTSHIYPTLTPHPYIGPKRWIALGRADRDEFLSQVLRKDPILKKVPYSELKSRVEYAYMADTYSTRNSSPAIKYVSEHTKGAYPVTHLKEPFDYFIEKKLAVKELSDES